MGIKRTASGRIYFDADDERQEQVVGLLGQLGERLKRSEAERDELWRELQDYRKTLTDLEDKNAKSEKAYLTLQNKIARYEQLETELAKRQNLLEKAYKEQAQKDAKASPGGDLLRRLSETESRARVLAEKLETALAEQKKIDRRLEKTVQDKMRMQRRIDRFEEVITETQDAIRSKALVVLTDHTMTPQGPPLLEDKTAEAQVGSWWARPVRLHAGGVSVLVIAALLGGWFISDVARMAVPQVAILDSQSLARLTTPAKGWEPIVVDGKPVAEETPAPPAAAEQKAEAAGPFDYQDEDKLAAAFEENPDDLAARLNDIVPTTAATTGDVAGLDDPVEKAAEPPAAKAGAEKAAPEAAKGSLKKDASLPPSDAASAQVAEPLTEPEPQSAKAAPGGDAQRGRPEAASAKGQAVTGLAPDKNLPEMLGELETKAFAGIPEAQHDLAAVYTAGHGGVKQNYERAAFWFRKAAEQGIANAAYNLGVLAHQGLGVKKDMNEAIKWYTQAAEQDHPEAQYNLGIAYIEGVGVPYDPEKAATYFEKAADKGIVEAAYNLGLIHENGLLGKPSPEEAVLWYKTAADWGSPEARSALDQLSKNLGIDPAEVDRIVGRMARPKKAAREAEAAPERKAEATALPLRASDLETTPVQQAALDQVVVRQIQQQLMDMGLYPGPADGTFGPVTEDAIRSYEFSHNLSVTGRPSEGLLVHMLARGTDEPVEQGDTEQGASP